MDIEQKSSFVFNWRGAGALIFGFFAGNIVVAALSVFSIFFFNVNLQYQDLYYVLVNGLSFVGAILAFDIFVVRPETNKKLHFNMSAKDPATLAIIFPLMLGMMLIAEFFTAQIPTTGKFFGDYYEYFSGLMDQMTKDKPTLILLVVVMAPVFEEIVFRGIIQNGLINNGIKPWKAIVFSAVIFGLVHGNPWQMLGAVLLGSVLGFVYFKTKSLLLPILLHAFNNLCSSLLIIYGNTESFADFLHTSEWLLLLVGIVMSSVFFYLFIKKYPSTFKF